MLTSTKNPLIQKIRLLKNNPKERARTGLFILEGVRLCEEALAANALPVHLLYTDNLAPRAQTLLDAFVAAGVQPTLVAPNIMAAVSDTKTSQGLLLVLPNIHLPVPQNADFFLLLDSVRDPGNLGTLFRTSAASGVHAVILLPGCASPFSPKVVRAAMGAHFTVPILEHTWESLPTFLAAEPKPRLYLADGSAKTTYTAANFIRPTALLIGSEAHGISAEAQALPSQGLSIPMANNVESLNAAAAAAILLFEVVRQRQS